MICFLFYDGADFAVMKEPAKRRFREMVRLFYSCAASLSAFHDCCTWLNSQFSFLFSSRSLILFSIFFFNAHLKDPSFCTGPLPSVVERNRKATKGTHPTKRTHSGEKRDWTRNAPLRLETAALLSARGAPLWRLPSFFFTFFFAFSTSCHRPCDPRRCGACPCGTAPRSSTTR